jgi:putative endonuclease
MAESHNLGQEGEEIAAGHLKKSGYKILHRNWKAGKLELDIIAENKDFIVFAEVKTRTDDFLENPVSAVNREKQRSMIFAANTYIQRNNIDKESRFDVITIIKKGDSHQIDHIEGAFYPTLK